MVIEQAIFTSARTTRGDGYQLASLSTGVSDDEAHELSLWGPSHGSLCDAHEGASSVNFHRLANGKYCISKTAAAGDEYSGRGARIYTQFLLVPPEIFARFANNPFAVLRAAWASGRLTVYEQAPKTLESFPLVGRSAAVDEGLLAQFADHYSPQQIGQLISAACADVPTLVCPPQRMETLLGGLLNCFPVECRGEISFTTGLRFSPRRQVRLGPIDSDPAEQHRLARHDGVGILDLGSRGGTGQLKGWAAYMAKMIAADRLPTVIGEIQQPRPGLDLSQLEALGECLLNEALTGAGEVGSIELESPQWDLDTDLQPSACFPLASPPTADQTATLADQAQAVLTSENTDASALVQQLDDAVHDAIGAVPGALQKVTEAWAELSAQLPPTTVHATREQYLRYTLTLWEAGADEGSREPDRAVAALDVLGVLFAGE